jgi:hypothetical protein
MSEVAATEEKVGLEGLFGNASKPSKVAEEAPKAEEEVKQETPEAKEEPTPEVKAEENPAEGEPKAETKVDNEEAEEKKETVTEDGFKVIDLGGEKKENPSEDIQEQLKALREQNKALLEEKERLASESDLDPRVKKINDWLKNGGELTREFWELQNKNYDNINFSDSKQSLSVLKDKLKYVDGLDEEEISYHIEKNYPILSGAEEALDDADERDERMG